MAERKVVTPWLTPFQAQLCVDALEMYVEGWMGQLTQRESREGRAAIKKLTDVLRAGDERSES